MTVDTRKVFKPRKGKLSTVREDYARQLAKAWLVASTTQERHDAAKLIGYVRRRENAIYIAAMAVAEVAKHDFVKANWLVAYFKNKY